MPLLLALYSIGLFFLIPQRSVGQGIRQGKQPGSENAIPVFIQAVNTPSDSIGKTRIDVLYSIPLDFFVFVKSATPTQFSARGDFAFEILNTTGVSVARRIITKSISADTVPEPTRGPLVSHRGVASFDLQAGEYTLSAEFVDLESSRKFQDRRHLTVRSFEGNPLHLSDALFYLRSGPTDRSSPIAFGGDLPFDSDAYAYLELLGSFNIDSISVRSTLSRLSPEGGSGSLVQIDSANGRDQIPQRRVVTADEYNLTFEERAPSPNLHPLILDIPSRSLVQGVYLLQVVASAAEFTDTLRHKFRVRWLDTPRSLASLPVAIEALKHICSDDEIVRMKHGDLLQHREAFDAYWKTKDPTPLTARNEIMEEYYRRVDYAIEHFSTFLESNGMRSDRGKAHVLYGKPTTVDRSFNPGTVPTEVWVYPSQKRRLVFIDQGGKGHYLLYANEDLR